MYIFIDESGTFSGNDSKNSVSAVGALVIPDQQIGGFEKLYGRLRRKLPLDKGEVKGRTLDEAQVTEVVSILHKLGCLFEVVVVDSAFQSEAEIRAHKVMQEENITRHLTENHYQTFVDELWGLRRQLEKTSLQLYMQSVAMAELVYNSINHANLYYSFRLPQELGSYHWVIDSKGRDKITPWEEWWSKVVMPMIESKSFREPMIAAEGGDYRWHDKFKVELSEYKRQFVNDPNKGAFFDLKPVLRKDFRFSSLPEYGLEAADILTNVVRRSMAGNFSREGWLPIRTLMVHWGQHYIRLVSLAREDTSPPSVPYQNVLLDFSKGGRAMLPPNYGG